MIKEFLRLTAEKKSLREWKFMQWHQKEYKDISNEAEQVCSHDWQEEGVLCIPGLMCSFQPSLPPFPPQRLTSGEWFGGGDDPQQWGRGRAADYVAVSGVRGQRKGQGGKGGKICLGDQTTRVLGGVNCQLSIVWGMGAEEHLSSSSQGGVRVGRGRRVTQLGHLRWATQLGHLRRVT